MTMKDEIPYVRPLDIWQKFHRLVYERLIEGEKVYGNKSVKRPTGDIIKDITEELADVCGWSCVLYARLLALDAYMKMNVKEPGVQDNPHEKKDN